MTVVAAEARRARPARRSADQPGEGEGVGLLVAGRYAVVVHTAAPTVTVIFSPGDVS